MATGTALDRFLLLCSDEIDRRAELSGQRQRHVLSEGAVAFSTALRAAEAGDPGGDRLPTVAATSCLIDLARSSKLVHAFQDASQEIPWIASPRMTDDGTEAALAPLNEVRDLGALICGLLLVRPGASYPEHSHPPQELYLPISGDGDWRYGGNDYYRTLGPSDLVYNNPNDIHAVHAREEPVLALYVLWG